MNKFVVRQRNGSETEFASVQEAFRDGRASIQKTDARLFHDSMRGVNYPAAYIKTEDGNYYGPILSP